MATELEVRDWLDRLAIQDLIARYSDAVTRADWDQCEAVFAPDAVWESPNLGLRYDDAASFLEMVRASTTDLLIQTPHSSVVLLDGDRATVTTTIHEMSRGVGSADSALGGAGAEINFEQWGIYYDDVARLEGEWKFTRRVFVSVYLNPGCMTGNVLTARSAMQRPG